MRDVACEFDIRDQRYPKPWCLLAPLNACKLESKLLSCLTLPLAGIKCISNPFRYFIKSILKLLVIFEMRLALSCVIYSRSSLSFALNRIICSTQFNYHHLFLPWNELKVESRLRSHYLLPFLSTIQCTGKVTYLIHIWRASKLWWKLCAYLTWPLIKIKYTANPIFRRLFHLCVKENQNWAKHGLSVEK